MSRGHYSRQSNALETKTVRLDGKSHASDNDLDRLKSKSSSHSSYERYKANLHAIFDGKAPLPTHIREIAEIRDGTAQTLEVTEAIAPAPKPEAPAPKSQRRLSPNQSPYSLFTEALRKSSTPEEIRRAVLAFREAGHAFPADEDLLSKALTFPDEDVVLELLGQLEGLLECQASKNPRLLASRLDDAALSIRPGVAKERIAKIKAKLKS